MILQQRKQQATEAVMRTRNSTVKTKQNATNKCNVIKMPRSPKTAALLVMPSDWTYQGRGGG